MTDSVSDTHINGVRGLLEYQREANKTRMRIVASASPSEYDELSVIDDMYSALIETTKQFMEDV